MTRAVLSMLERARNAQAKLAVGTPQHSLQRNRIAALEVALKLLNGEDVTGDELQAARAPIASLLGKSEKSVSHFSSGKWQYDMLDANIKALKQVQTLIEKESR